VRNVTAATRPLGQIRFSKTNVDTLPGEKTRAPGLRLSTIKIVAFRHSVGNDSIGSKSIQWREPGAAIGCSGLHGEQAEEIVAKVKAGAKVGPRNIDTLSAFDREDNPVFRHA
jgi:hypothetical protein